MPPRIENGMLHVEKEEEEMKGKTKVANGGKGAGGYMMNLVDAGGRIIMQTEIAENGEFAFASVPKGVYKVELSKKEEPKPEEPKEEASAPEPAKEEEPVRETEPEGETRVVAEIETEDKKGEEAQSIGLFCGCI